MGVKSERKKLNGLMGGISGVPEFTENLNDQLHFNKLSEASKKVIKNTLARKFREFDILDTEPVRCLVKNMSQFTKNITSDKKYQDCVLEINNNIKQVKLSNSLTEIRNLNKRNKKKGKK